MDAAAFEIYTEQLRAALESVDEVIGLVTLGTTVDSSFRDEWSDHDFWVITKRGRKTSFFRISHGCPRLKTLRFRFPTGNVTGPWCTTTGIKSNLLCSIPTKRARARFNATEFS